MAKLVKLDKAYWPRGGYGHWCPGCKSGHEIDTESKNASGAIWTFDGNVYAPTFHPSVNIRWGRFADPSFEFADGNDHGGVCHYTITAGRITFHGDTTHLLSGQTVDLPEIPDDKYRTCQRLGTEAMP